MRNADVTVAFNGHDLRDYVYGITDIRRDILPPRDLRTVEDGGMDGALLFGVRRGPSLVEVDIQIKARSFKQLRERVDDLGGVLDTDGVSDLVITDEGDKTRRAIFTGQTELDEIVHTGKGTLQFFQPKPHRYGGLESKQLSAPPNTWEDIENKTWEGVINEHS